jgi:hypothetical protein
LLGDWLVRTLISESFAPVAACASWMLVASMCFCGGATCNGLLFVRERPGRAAANSVSYSVVTVAGLALVLGGEGAASGAAVAVAKIYALAAAVFFAEAWIGLGIGAGLWLPLGRSALLALPAALVPWLASLTIGLGARAALALALVAGYAAAAVATGLLPARELRELRALLRAPRRPREPSPDEIE